MWNELVVVLFRECVADTIPYALGVISYTIIGSGCRNSTAQLAWTAFQRLVVCTGFSLLNLTVMSQDSKTVVQMGTCW